MAATSVNAQRTYLDQTTIDRSIKPGDDFHLCERRVDQREPDSCNRSSLGQRGHRSKKTRLRLHELIKTLSGQENKPGSDEQKLHDFYRSGTDTLTRFV